MNNRDELQRLARQVEHDRSRLEEIQHQIERVGTIHSEHADTCKVLETIASSKSSGHVPVGAGVLIPFTSKDKVLIDLGSGLYGERQASDAKQLILERQNDLTELLEKLQTEGQALNDKIEQTAQTFTQMAQAIDQPSEAAVSEPPAPPTNQENDPSPKKRRRGFGSELTLDD